MMDLIEPDSRCDKWPVTRLKKKKKTLNDKSEIDNFQGLLNPRVERFGNVNNFPTKRRDPICVYFIL